MSPKGYMYWRPESEGGPLAGESLNEIVQKRFSERAGFLNNVMGKTPEEARELCLNTPYSIRVMMNEGEGLYGTCDMKADRLNVSIVDGKINGGNWG